MKSFLLIIIGTVAAVLVFYSGGTVAAPIKPENNNKDIKDSKSAFGMAFDEIVVESSLTVKRKPGARIARNRNVTIATVTEDKKITKRQIKPGFRGNGASSAAANAQSQAFNIFGPLGSFGAGATGSQTQALAFGPKGPVGSAAFSGTQQYQFNGQTIDIAFGNAFGGAGGNSANANGAAISITGPDGKKRPFNG